MSVAGDGFGAVRATLGRTRWAVGAALRRGRARLVFVGVTVGYLLVYLYATGDLTPGGGEVGLTVVERPLARAVERTGALAFEPIALVELGPVDLLFSPINVLLGAAVAALVGANLAVTYLAQTQPNACGLGASAGALAGLPALLSGAACCGPVVLVALGVQASGLLLATFDVLVPVAAALLVGSLLYVGRQVDPEAA